MNDTKQRIAEYSNRLPWLKERVVAVALLLAISLTMVATTTFAWVVLSRSPAVTGVTTNVATNGNLEIALVAPNGALPAESAVGDSYAASGQSIVAANLTWGNMINLTDPSYGLDNLVLRPAQLNKAALLTNPLYGAEYGEDGRIIKLNSNFAYTTWHMPEGNKPGYFGVTSSDSGFGVRAISSTKIEAVGAEAAYLRMVAAARDTNLLAANQYSALRNNSSQMQSLATMMGLYMTARMNPSEDSLNNPDCAVADIQNLADMYAGFLEAFELEAEAMAALLNLRAFLKFGEGNYTPYTGEMIFTVTNSELKSALDIEISKLTEFQKDHTTIETDLAVLQSLSTSGTSLKWKDSGLNTIVNHLVDVGKCTIGADNTPISSIGASNALGYLSGTQEARITNGILYRFEERTGGYIEVKNLAISAKVKRMGITVPATVKANIQTTAPRDYFLFNNDLEAVKATNTGDYQGGEAVAEDTFGLAIDFWVRTNALGHYLVLEGNVLTKKEEVRATGTDPFGNKVELYLLSRTFTDETSGESFTEDYTLYCSKIDENGTTQSEDIWYNYGTHERVELADGEVPSPKMIEVETVIGYEGENRVWNRDNEGNKLNLTVNSTTQGSGSCYVYYADTPEQQARSLELLKSMKVAFVDANGKLMATADMDTERHYAANGKVIVPLALNSSDSINLGETREGETVYGITALEQNVATRVTAIVYLDGLQLTNEDVLAAASIQGQLNIQFGAYADDLQNAENEKLKGEEVTVGASVDKTSMDYDTAQTPADLTTTVSVNVTGSQPNSVTAFFLRAINSTQGSREAMMTFTRQEDGSWKANYTFTAPGHYILRSVRLDGVEYDLTERPEVLVKGFTIKSLSCQEADENRHISVMTADGSYTVNLSLAFASDDQTKMPKKVQGRFLRDTDGSAVTVDFTYHPASTQWTGSASFLSSGAYTLQYLILDGEYVELSPELQQTATVYLGMRVAIYTTSPHKFLYAPSEMAANERALAMQMKILDNAGNEMPGLNRVKLTYGMKSSGAKIMDATLTWDGTYYVGEFPMVDSTTDNGAVIERVGGPGIWQFSSVTVGDSIITNASIAPVFTILSPEPPAYHAHRTPTYQYAPNNNASMNVHIANSEAAVVWAYIVESGATEGIWVAGELASTYEYVAYEGATPMSVAAWNFPVPVNEATRYQDGNWKLTALRLWDVFAADGTPFTEESPLELDVSEKNVTSKVVCQVNVSFLSSQSRDFGKDANGNVTGVFMQSHTISGLQVRVTDFAGDAVKDDKGNLLVTGVTLTFTHNGDSEKYGGYTSTLFTKATYLTIFLEYNPTTLQFEQVAYQLSDGSDRIESATAPLLYAGSYTTTMSVWMGSTETKFAGSMDTATTKKLPAGAPVVTVSSIAPGVTMTAAEYASKSGGASTITNGTTTVYFKESTETACGITYYNYTPAKVTLQLTGYGEASAARMDFTTSNADGVVHLYEESQRDDGKSTNAYTWSGDGTCIRYMGAWESKTGSDSKTAAGTLTSTALILTHGGEEFTVDVTIVIHNPS